MAPICGPFGPMGRFVRYVTPASWLRPYNLAAPHGRFCGVMALVQLSKGLHFLSEQICSLIHHGPKCYPTTMSYDKDMAGVRRGSKLNLALIKELLSSSLQQ
eukprot:4830892-Heterocapsa_arctica.AAC.1